MTKPLGPVNIKRPNIGLKRITQRTPSNVAEATRQVRSQMDDILWNMRRVVEGIEGITEEALRYGLEPIFATSQELVPLKTGALQASGYLEVITRKGRIEAEIGYAKGGVPDYAIEQHENLDFYHQPPRQAKFLQTAIDMHLDEVRDRIVSYIKQAVPQT